jgi:hypothetical protein
MHTKDIYTYTLGQDEVESAPTITFRQFRRLAKRHEWSLEWLVEQCKDHIDNPTATIRRVLEGAIVNGKRERLEDTVIP